jgi:hypothetical protein
MDVHTLAVQMGTSILMIERHYSHLTPRLKKKCLQASAMTRLMKNTKQSACRAFSISEDDLQSPVGDVMKKTYPTNLKSSQEKPQ